MEVTHNAAMQEQYVAPKLRAIVVDDERTDDTRRLISEYGVIQEPYACRCCCGCSITVDP